MRTNGILDDPEPLQQPKEPTATSVPASDWEKLGNAPHYPEVNDYINTKIAFYQRYLPGGVPIEQLKEEDRNAAWGQATTVIGVLEELQAIINMQKR